MAFVPEFDDYYATLEVSSTALPEAITKSYKRLALARHPDRNQRADATETFQLVHDQSPCTALSKLTGFEKLQKAYETLNDEAKRRIYDIIYAPELNRRKEIQAHPEFNDAELEEHNTILKRKQARTTRWARATAAINEQLSQIKIEILHLQTEIDLLESGAAERNPYSTLDSSIGEGTAGSPGNNSTISSGMSTIEYRNLSIMTSRVSRANIQHGTRRGPKCSKILHLNVKNTELARLKEDKTREQAIYSRSDQMDEFKIKALKSKALGRRCGRDVADRNAADMGSKEKRKRSEDVRYDDGDKENMGQRKRYRQ